MEIAENNESKELNEAFVKRKEKIKNWFKNSKNLYLALIILAVIAIRFYYFWITKNQPVWWDESEYLSAAKSYAGIVDFKLAEQRLPGYPLLLSSFFMIGITNETALRFFFNFLPSILAIILLYFLIGEMYKNKWIAVISTIIFTVLWEHMFYSNRFQTENLSLVFEFLAALVIFKVYIKNENLWIIKPKFSLIWIFVFSFICILIRPGNLFFLPAAVAFLLLLNQSFFYHEKYKKYALLSVAGLIAISVFILINLEKIPLLRNYYYPERTFSWVSLTVFNGFYSSVVPKIPPVFFYVFLLGAFISLANIILIIDKIKIIKRDKENMDLKSDIFNFLLFFSTFSVFIFLMRSKEIEMRWFFLILPAMLSFTSKGIIFVSEFVGNILKNKKISIAIILLLLSFGIYNQMIHADSIIKNKLDSYSQIRDAGLWIRQNSEKQDIVVSSSFPQNTYYSERKTINFNDPSDPYLSTLKTEDEFINLSKTMKPRFYVVSGLEASPQWAYQFPEKYKSTLTPVQVYFADAEKKQPILVIYEFENYDFNKETAKPEKIVNSS